MNEIKGIIFDWAGTTVDYGCFAPVQAFAEVFRHFGIEPTSQEVREPMGMLKIDHIRTMLRMPRISALWEEKYGRKPEEKDVKELFGLFEEKLMSILHLFAGPKPGVAETVKALREKGIAIGSTTGYTDKMMAIVAPEAAKRGYAPDVWFSPDSVNQKGRPYPYMIFRNMEALGLSDVRGVLKVGDTVSDIMEGKSAGVFSIGIIEGSSEMGLSREEYDSLTGEEKSRRAALVTAKYAEAGADAVIHAQQRLVQSLRHALGHIFAVAGAGKIEDHMKTPSQNIFNIVAEVDKNPCYLCARMRRGYLYSHAKELGCNKIALGHHYDDVIETILMGMLYGAQVQTMMPKLHSTNFEGMELIRPLYLIREADIIHWANYNDLHFIQCACRFTEHCASCGGTEKGSKRAEIKELIHELAKKDPVIEYNIFRSVENVNLNTVIGYKQDGVRHNFLDTYDEQK